MRNYSYKLKLYFQCKSKNNNISKSTISYRAIISYFIKPFCSSFHLTLQKIQRL